MKITLTGIKDLVVIEPLVHGDDRGYFMESFKLNWFKDMIGDVQFIQDNESRSKKGVLRGLHFQTGDFAQAKLVRVLDGEVIDVAVDLRPNSITYGKHFSILLSSENKKQFFIPRGFAHGFLVLSEFATFAYKVDNVYSQENEGGLLWSDPDLNIEWGLDQKEIILSPKDALLPKLSELNS
jgi:dTDP-4-dehydrorhamnose 3,5-epimerase